jgi:ABC-type glycerol-3-phosphate transport system substrate-binding protein
VRKLHLLLLPALLLALALGLAACGSGGESDEDKITTTIENAATSTDPAVCGETQTLAFMEQTSGGSGGKEAEKECEEEAKSGEGQPDSVSVSKVKVDGENATADAAFKGGIFDAQTLELALVEEDGDWKLDELTGFAKLDPESLVAAFAEQIEEEPEIEPETASCFIEGIEELSNSELESVIVENNTEAFGEIAEGCE